MNILYRNILLTRSIQFQLEAFHTNCYQGNRINSECLSCYGPKFSLKKRVNWFQMTRVQHTLLIMILDICDNSMLSVSAIQEITSTLDFRWTFHFLCVKDPQASKKQGRSPSAEHIQRLGYLTCYWFMTLPRYKHRTW